MEKLVIIVLINSNMNICKHLLYLLDFLLQMLTKLYFCHLKS